MSEVAKDAGGAKKSVAKLNNVLMQMRKNANHPGGLPLLADAVLLTCRPAVSCSCTCAPTVSSLHTP